MPNFKIQENIFNSKEICAEKYDSTITIFFCGQRATNFLLSFKHFLKPREVRCENNGIQLQCLYYVNTFHFYDNDFTAFQH